MPNIEDTPYTPISHKLLSMIYNSIVQLVDDGITSITLRFRNTKLFNKLINLLLYETVMFGCSVSNITKKPVKYISITLTW
jgi:hypothetical protein